MITPKAKRLTWGEALPLKREHFHYRSYLPKCNKPAGKFSVADIPESRVTHTVVHVCIHMQMCQGTLLVHIGISASAAVFTFFEKKFGRPHPQPFEKSSGKNSWKLVSQQSTTPSTARNVLNALCLIWFIYSSCLDIILGFIFLMVNFRSFWNISKWKMLVEKYIFLLDLFFFCILYLLSTVLSLLSLAVTRLWKYIFFFLCGFLKKCICFILCVGVCGLGSHACNSCGDQKRAFKLGTVVNGWEILCGSSEMAARVLHPWTNPSPIFPVLKSYKSDMQCSNYKYNPS